jgi:hypothetical protein
VPLQRQLLRQRLTHDTSTDYQDVHGQEW